MDGAIGILVKSLPREETPSRRSGGSTWRLVVQTNDTPNRSSISVAVPFWRLITALPSNNRIDSGKRRSLKFGDVARLALRAAWCPSPRPPACGWATREATRERNALFPSTGRDPDLHRSNLPETPRIGRHRLLVIGHFKLEALDHLIMFSIAGGQGERLLHCRRRDKRIENVKAM